MTLPKPRKIQIERYVEGLSQFKKIDNPIKLSANESAQERLKHLREKKIKFLNIQNLTLLH